MTIISDYFVVASAPNTSHVQTLAQEVQFKLAEEEVKPLRVEGEREGRWVVIDYGDVLVHIFHKDEREFYQLERLWKVEGISSIILRNRKRNKAAYMPIEATGRYDRGYNGQSTVYLP